MSNYQELKFINGARSRLLLVIEPSSSEFWIERGATVRILVVNQSNEQALEIEYLPGGMVVYTSSSGQVAVYQNGRRLSQGNQSKRMAINLRH